MSAQPERGALQNELALVLQSPEFVRSPVLRKLLEYLVEQTLAGNGERLKAYQIAVDGLGRDDGFDPQSDSYPRVQVGRLRKMLDLHYAALPPAAAASRQRITIPVGRYTVGLAPIVAPTVELASPEAAVGGQAADAPAMATGAGAQAARHDAGQGIASAPVPPQSGNRATPATRQRTVIDRGWLVWAVPIILLLVALYALWLVFRPDDTAIRSIQAQLAHVGIVTVPPGGNDDLNTAAQIAEMHLQRFEMLAVSMGGHADSASADHKAREYELLLRGGAGQQGRIHGPIFLSLRHRESGQTLWSSELPGDDSSTAAPDFEQAIGAGISIIARSGGLIAQHQRKQIGSDMRPGYPCLIQYDTFRQRRDPALRPRLQACLSKSLEMYPDEPLFLQALSYLALSQPQKGRQKPLAPSNKGRAFAEAALEFDSRSSLAQIAVARSAVARGNCPRAIAFSRRAVESNPLEPDTLGIAGTLLMSCGDYTGAQSALERALEMNSQPGGFQTSSLVIVRLMNGQPQAALDLALRSETPELVAQPNFLLAKALSQAANGRLDAGKRTWARLERTVGVSAGVPATDVMARFAISPFFSRRMVAEAERTGLVQAKG